MNLCNYSLNLNYFLKISHQHRTHYITFNYLEQLIQLRLLKKKPLLAFCYYTHFKAHSNEPKVHLFLMDLELVINYKNYH